MHGRSLPSIWCGHPPLQWLLPCALEEIRRAFPGNPVRPVATPSSRFFSVLRPMLLALSAADVSFAPWGSQWCLSRGCSPANPRTFSLCCLPAISWSTLLGVPGHRLPWIGQANTLGAQYTERFFWLFWKRLLIFKLLSFLNGLSYRNELGGILKNFFWSFRNACGFYIYLVGKWLYHGSKVNELFCPRLYCTKKFFSICWLEKNNSFLLEHEHSTEEKYRGR